MRWFFGIMGVTGAAAFYIWQGFVLYQSGAMQMSGFEWTVFSVTVSLAGIGSVALLIFEAALLPACRREFRRGNWMTGGLGIVVLTGITMTMIVMDVEGLLTARADRAAERHQVAEGVRNIAGELAAAEGERSTWRAKLENTRVSRADIVFLSSQLAATNRRIDALRSEQQTAKTNGGASPAPAFFAELDGSHSAQWWLLALMITGIVVRAVLRATMFYIATTLLEDDPKERRRAPFDFKGILASHEPAKAANDDSTHKSGADSIKAPPAAARRPDAVLPVPRVIPPTEGAILREILCEMPAGVTQFADIEAKFGQACLRHGIVARRERLTSLLATLEIAPAAKNAKGARYKNHLGKPKGQAVTRSQAAFPILARA